MKFKNWRRLLCSLLRHDWIFPFGKIGAITSDDYKCARCGMIKTDTEEFKRTLKCQVKQKNATKRE